MDKRPATTMVSSPRMRGPSARGLTINAGSASRRNTCRAKISQAGGITHPINFGWGDKIAPRVGAAWDVFRTGKMKIFGGYGEFYDQMKLNLAISSFGGQYWQNATMLWTPPNFSSIAPHVQRSDRYCGGTAHSASQANFGGSTPAGDIPRKPELPSHSRQPARLALHRRGRGSRLKPYAQHDSASAWTTNSGRLSRLKRDRIAGVLDHVIEDSAIFNPGRRDFRHRQPGPGCQQHLRELL